MPASINTGNQSPLRKAQVFSDFMLEHINDGFLPDGLHRDVGDFSDGDVIFIPVWGEGILRDFTEGTNVEFDSIDTGQISLTITDYVSAGSSISDKVKQDSYKAAAMEAMIPKEHMRLIKERYESDLLAQGNKQTPNNPNLINGFAHRWVAHSGATAGVMTLDDFLYAQLSADKANLPEQNRIAIVDPITAAALNASVAAQAFINNPQFEGIVNTGFAKGRRFLANIFGWDVWVSNRLALASETITGGPASGAQAIVNGKVNIFGVFADDQHTPFMGAWRQMPVTEGFRNATAKQDEYSTTARWGFGVQRFESLICVITSATAFK